MTNLKCLIVDDEEVSRMVVRDFIKRTEGLELSGEFDNAVSAYDVLKNTPVDLLFLDIEMPQMTGIELVQSLEKLPEVILITGRRDFGAEAYEYNLTDYLIKPITYPRFLKAVEKAKLSIEDSDQKLVENSSDDILYVKADNKIVKLSLSEIFFVEALSDYMLINTKDKKYIVHSTMKALEKKFPENFVRVHRSYIANLDKINTIEDMQIVMPQKSIPIGNSYKSNFLSKLNFL
ncbi:LytR/AlgR family response regulator transcription factor [Flammeovirga kamogawensis]|uniref:LytR/AlgR family response regulator transcription factor n=1 Tax=Flammeovirga kamogawensis TaxID=373891 RepID=UPI00184AA8D0|nr:LytTR family DNA-binding domain-containing protein [Flammeovirga kamogawensis]MBB6461419.1 DNA-binding LytR/AlgR family response regulator [Flammeovirga kamogawensis]